MAMGEKCNRAIEEAATCSAVYLLSADRFLCSRALAAIDQEGIHFSKIHIHGVDLDGYVLFHMARDLYQGSSHIRLSELTDPELVSDRVFEWIMTACVIRRHGSRVYERRKEVLTGVKSDSISEKTTERSVLRFFSPLIATMYTKDDWGNLEEYGEEVFPAELCSYETEILKRIAEENLEEEGDRGLAVYLDDPKLEEKFTV